MIGHDMPHAGALRALGEHVIIALHVRARFLAGHAGLASRPVLLFVGGPSQRVLPDEDVRSDEGGVRHGRARVRDPGGDAVLAPR
jgi:hypothetical protein